MPLQKQVMPLILTQGVNASLDPRVLPPLGLTTLENGIIRQSGRIDKRLGTEALGASIVGTNTELTGADALATFNNELLAFANQTVYSYSEGTSTWIDKGAAVSVSIESDPIFRNDYAQTQVDQAVAGQTAITAWEDNRGGVRFSLHDLSNGTIIGNDILVDATASIPRCASLNGTLYLFYTKTTNIYARQINLINPSTLLAEHLVASNFNASHPHYDVIEQDYYLVLVYNVTAATQIKLCKISANLTIIASTTITEAATNCLTVVRANGSNLYVAWCNATGVRYAIFNIFLTQTVAPTDVENGMTTAVRIAGCNLVDSTGIHLFYEVTGSQVYFQYIKHSIITITPSTPTVYMRSVGIASKPFYYGNYIFIAVVHSSLLQATYFISRNDGVVVAKIGQGAAGGLLLRSLVSQVYSPMLGIFYFCGLIKSSLIALGGDVLLRLTGVNCFALDFTKVTNFQNIQLGETSQIISGGVVQGYDGRSVNELGFHLYPENISLTQSTDSSGHLTLTDSYSYSVCYEWTDGQGILHRSAPSPAQLITLTGSNNRVTLAIPTLALTGKSNVQIVVYRTQGNSTIVYRASDPISPTYNNPATDTVTYVDNLADSILASRELIYTTGSVLENIAPPASSVIGTYLNRVCVVSAEDNALWVSKEKVVNTPVMFNDALTIPVDPLGGKVTAVAQLDDKFIVFKTGKIYYTFGQGPTDTGSGNDYLRPQILASDVGCINSNSVILIKDGLLFLSAKGFYLLTHSLSLTFVGAPVQDLRTLEIVGAVVLEDISEVRFVALDGPTQVWNYQYNQWSTFPGYESNDVQIWKGKSVRIATRPSHVARIGIESDVSFLDYGQTYPLAIETGWISLAGIQAFQRIYRLILLGDFKTAHTLQVLIGYNFEKTYNEEHRWNVVTALPEYDYGEDTYGVIPIYGGSISAYQVRIHLGRQKCEAIRVKIKDLNPTDTGQSYSLVGMALQFGAKAGVMKLPVGASL